jgi:hypothetical protein
VQRRCHVALALRVSAELDDRRNDHTEADKKGCGWQLIAGCLLAEDSLVLGRKAQPPRLGPGEADEAGIGECRLERLLGCEVRGGRLSRVLPFRARRATRCVVGEE